MGYKGRLVFESVLLDSSIYVEKVPSVFDTTQ